MQPIIKWTGSKRLVVKELIALQPKSYNNYYEPFLGSGAMSYYQKGGYLSDTCKPLIDLWTVIKENPVKLLESYTHHRSNLIEYGSDYYFQTRWAFNITLDPYRFFFLIRTCTGGLIRFNKKGEFNTAYNYGRNGIEPKKLAKILNNWQPIIQKFNYSVQNFTQIEPKSGDFVFLDPPYETTNAMYMGNFDYEVLYEFLDKLNKNDTYWMLTTRTEIPRFLYQRQTNTSGGNSSFRRLKNKGKKTVKEFVYLNY